MNAKNQKRLKIGIIAALILLGLFLLYTLFFKKAATSGAVQGAVTSGAGTSGQGVTIVTQAPASPATPASQPATSPDAAAIAASTAATQQTTSTLGTLTTAISAGFAALQNTLSNFGKVATTGAPKPNPIVSISAPVVVTGQGSVASRPTLQAAAARVAANVPRPAAAPVAAYTPGYIPNAGNIQAPRAPGQPAHVL